MEHFRHPWITLGIHGAHSASVSAGNTFDIPGTADLASESMKRGQHLWNTLGIHETLSIHGTHGLAFHGSHLESKEHTSLSSVEHMHVGSEEQTSLASMEHTWESKEHT
ncbi:hypothetical protein BaRGS_00038887 [Batillaria attramentaria]|uniref:Uncharacterized protein n=1 Tax=Batillaria attramentaria TaxID=370345 RepID=A0ABD0J5I6_9CAEN